MATTSYGSITIVDITDVGDFSVYPQANKAQTQIYNPDQNGNLAYTPSWDGNNNALVITPVAFYAGKNKTSVATYSWKKYVNGVETNFTANEVVANTARHESLTINANILTTSNPMVTYEVTASYSSPELGATPLEAVGRIDFSLISQGSSVASVNITGDNIFAYDAIGQLKAIGSDPIILTATYYHVTAVGWKYKSGSSWVTYPSTYNGTTPTTTTGNTPTLKVFAQQTDDGTSSGNLIFVDDRLTIRYEGTDVNNQTVYDEFTVVKLRDGGMIATATLTNDDQMIPADKDGHASSSAFGEATTTKVTIYDENGNDDTSNWDITISGTTGLTYKVSKNGSTWNNPDNTDKAYTYVKVTDITDAVSTGSILFSCTHKTDQSAPRIEKTFSLVKINAGQDGADPEIYDIKSSVVAVNRAKNADGTGGAYNPTSVTFTAYKTVGNTTSTYSNGFIRVFADGTVKDTSTTARSSVEYTMSTSPGAQVIQAVLYSENTFTNELASQSVIVTNDGSKGANGQNGLGAINVVIDNEHSGLNCNANNQTTSSQSIVIHFTGYQGTTSRSTTISNPTLTGISYQSGGSTITSITGTVSGNTITFTIPSGATLAASGSAELSFGILGQHYNNSGTLVDDSSRTTITKLFTWNRNAAPAEAVTVVMEYPNGQVYQNNTGTLTVKAIVYDGGSPITASNATYVWQQYDGTIAGDDKYGSLKSGATASGNTLTVNASAVDSYASFRVTVTYPTGGATYKAFASLIDKFDPLQISVHSTIGTQIKNGQGFGALFVKVREEGNEIDEIPLDIEAVTATSQADSNATYCILCVQPSSTTGTDDTVASRGSATLYKKTSGTWAAVSNYDCTYAWTYHDINGNALGTGDRKPAISGKCVYIDASLIQSKITADVTVTKN